MPRKNVALCAGRPLIAWTLEAADKSTLLTDIVVSTDDSEIAEVAKANTLSGRVLMRPAHLAEDETPTEPVVRHVLENLGYEPDIIVLLQPTSPLRTGQQVDEAIRLLTEAIPARLSAW